MQPTITRPELLTDGSDWEFRDLVHSILAFSALHERIRDGHARYIGITGPQYSLMTAVRHFDGPTIGQVAAHLCVTSTFIAAETKKLKAAGLIAKTRNASDSRVVNLSLTGAGEDLLDELSHTQRGVNDVEFDRLTRADFDDLRRLLALLIENSSRAVELQRFVEGVPISPRAAASR